MRWSVARRVSRAKGKNKTIKDSRDATRRGLENREKITELSFMVVGVRTERDFVINNLGRQRKEMIAERMENKRHNKTENKQKTAN